MGGEQITSLNLTTPCQGGRVYLSVAVAAASNGKGVFEMNKRCFALAVLATAGITSSALADGRATITDATSAYNGSDGNGGAFTVTRATPGANGDYNGKYGDNRVSGDGRVSDSFLSFCIEVGDTLGFGSTYYTQISTSALRDSGVGSGNTNPDDLSGVTAKIYREFRSFVSDASSATIDPGTAFGGLLGSSLDSNETTAIQQAIWYTENEIGSISGTALSIYNWAVANSDGALHGVRVLRLWDNYNASTGVYSGSHQDLLTIIPLPPSAYAGLGTLAAILGFGYIRRRNLAAV